MQHFTFHWCKLELVVRRQACLLCLYAAAASSLLPTHTCLLTRVLCFIAANWAS